MSGSNCSMISMGFGGCDHFEHSGIVDQPPSLLKYPIYLDISKSHFQGVMIEQGIQEEKLRGEIVHHWDQELLAYVM